MCISTTTVEINMEAPHKTTNRSITRSTSASTGDIAKGNKVRISKRHLHPKFIAALFSRAERWEQPKCTSTDA
jgi:hypothetical protein